MSRPFLIFTIVSAVLSLNAVRPPRFAVTGGWVFFSGWITSELAPWWLAVQIGLTIWALLRDAATPFALALSVLSMVALTLSIVHAWRLREPDEPVAWRAILMPLRFRHRAVKRVRNVAYGPHGRRNRLDVFMPRAAGTRRPAILQVHGGGWVIGFKEQQARPLLLHFAAKGYVCFAINYRLSPRSRWPAHIVDVKTAIAWIKAHADEYGVDPDTIIITGGSAGGHLSSLASLSGNDPAYQPGFEASDTSVRACISFYGVYDWTGSSGTFLSRYMRWFIARVIVKRSFNTHPTDFEQASPILRVRPDAPPFLVIHGTNDTLAPVSEARAFVERLRGVSRAPVEYIELRGAQHAFDVWGSLRTIYVIRRVDRFLDQLLSPSATPLAQG